MSLIEAGLSVCDSEVCLSVKYKFCGLWREIKTSGMIYNFLLDADTNEILFPDKTEGFKCKNFSHQDKVQMVELLITNN